MTPPPAPSDDVDALRAELAAAQQLVQSVQAELIKSQITVLELQDTILQKETDKADAVALLGQAELTLESKINYIFELDRVLNEKISALQTELAKTRADHEIITGDLVQKLDLANRDLGATHTLAGTYAREASEIREKLTATEASLSSTRQALDSLQDRFSTLSQEHTTAEQQIERLQADLVSASSSRDALAAKLAHVRSSFAWKVSAPLRALFGPKL